MKPDEDTERKVAYIGQCGIPQALPIRPGEPPLVEQKTALKEPGGSVNYILKNGNYVPVPMVMAETYGPGRGLYLPHPKMMQEAFISACIAKDKRLPGGVVDAFYNGVNIDSIPTSEDLTRAANEGRLLLAHKTYFDDFLSSEYYRGALRPDKSTVDTTIPLSTVAQKAHVQLLVRAFNNTNDCEDNPQMIKPFDERRHDARLVEVLCWGLLKGCIMRATSDEPLMCAYEPTKAKNTPGLDDFATRFNAMVRSMCVSKTICKHLYDAPYVNTFVDDPIRAVKRVTANRDLNRMKGHVMDKGKKKLEEEGNGSADNADKPAKRRRRNPAAEADEMQDVVPAKRNPRKSKIISVHVPTSPLRKLTEKHGLGDMPTSPMRSDEDILPRQSGKSMSPSADAKMTSIDHHGDDEKSPHYGGMVMPSNYEDSPPQSYETHPMPPSRTYLTSQARDKAIADIEASMKAASNAGGLGAVDALMGNFNSMTNMSALARTSLMTDFSNTTLGPRLQPNYDPFPPTGGAPNMVGNSYMPHFESTATNFTSGHGRSAYINTMGDPGTMGSVNPGMGRGYGPSPHGPRQNPFGSMNPPGFSYAQTPMYNRANTSAPTTPAMTSFVNSGSTSMSEDLFPTSRPRLVPQEVTRITDVKNDPDTTPEDSKLYGC